MIRSEENSVCSILKIKRGNRIFFLTMFKIRVTITLHDSTSYKNYNVRLVLMLRIHWLWHTANVRLSVENREKPYTRYDRSLSSVRKVWVTQIKVQIPVRRTKVDISSVRNTVCLFRKWYRGSLCDRKFAQRISRSSRETRCLIFYNNTFILHTTLTRVSALTYQ